MESRHPRRRGFGVNGQRFHSDPDVSPRLLTYPPAVPENPLYFRLVVCLWILFLFEPARLISFYAHALSPLKWIPELLLYGTSVLWLLSRAPKRHMKWFTVFFGLMLFGTVIAFVFGNWGVARLVVRQMFQYFALGVLTFTFCDSPERAGTIVRLYFFSFLYYGLWGLISLKMEPIADEIDPQIRQIVQWHIHFNNRDGFGPLMVMGFAFSFYFYRAAASRVLKLLAVISLFSCIVGILTSFGRGVFLASIATIGYMWYRAKHKLVGVVLLVAAALVIMYAVPEFMNRYLSTMRTIFSEGTTGGTGLDRKILWGWAWREFLSSPIFGVGTGNFGIAIFRIVSLQEIVAAGYTPGRLWGRSLHCAPMTVLCEYGLVGAAVMIRLLVDSVRTNGLIRRNASDIANLGAPIMGRSPYLSKPSALSTISIGLMAAFVAVLVSSFFYEILYTPLLWHVVIINQVVFLASLQTVRRSESQLA
jgi:hypothetical protein